METCWLLPLAYFFRFGPVRTIYGSVEIDELINSIWMGDGKCG
jgi:hypothetical protein